ncbi:MAG: MFS transporter, partial [Bdellovibrionaceae bacterium]|nr:MFS transporter [Pseudobdellovibrionaceae bacterium]
MMPGYFQINLHLPWSDPLGRNIRLFYLFRMCFNARFYYPVFAILFLDLGLSVEQFAWLNVVWAATIVVLEVPSGAVADALGRVRMLQLAGFLMVGEMVLLMLAAAEGAHAGAVFGLLLANRVVSGAAEAMASGADEALAYDSLVAVHFEKDWERVLAKAMRYQSAAFIVAMLAGGYLYDVEAWQDRVPGWF